MSSDGEFLMLNGIGFQILGARIEKAHLAILTEWDRGSSSWRWSKLSKCNNMI